MVHGLDSAHQPVSTSTGVGTVLVLALAEAMIASVVRAVRARRSARTAIPAVVFEHSPSGAALADGAGRVRGANPTLARWCDTTQDAMVGRYLADLVEPVDAGALAAVLDPDPASPTHAEVRLLTGGAVRWVRLLAAHLPPAPDGTGFLCVVQVEDAGEHRATTARLAHDARHDALTGLPNRRALRGELAALLADPGRGAALVMIDLDGFKAVNDRLGHDAGDELLQVVAARLRSCLRPGDVAGRLGGDEMLVLAREVADDAGADAVGQRILAALLGPVSLRAGTAVVRASIGLRRVGADDHDALALVRDADTALYRAKAHGGCCARRARSGDVGAGAPAVPATPTIGT